MNLRVVTLNLWGRYGDDRATRRSVIAEGLRRLHPDLVAFQEALKTEEYDDVVELLGADYHVAHQTERESDGSGRRWPVACPAPIR